MIQQTPTSTPGSRPILPVDFEGPASLCIGFACFHVDSGIFVLCTVCATLNGATTRGIAGLSLMPTLATGRRHSAVTEHPHPAARGHTARRHAAVDVGTSGSGD